MDPSKRNNGPNPNQTRASTFPRATVLSREGTKLLNFESKTLKKFFFLKRDKVEINSKDFRNFQKIPSYFFLDAKSK